MATIKQKLAVSKVVENGGNVSQGMIDAGYSAATANTPQKLTESKGWQELMDEHFPEERLAKKIDEGIDATKVKSSMTEPDKIVPDYPTQHKFTETALKLRGKLKDDEQEKVVQNLIVFNVYEGSNTQANGSIQSPTQTANGSSDSL